jgi:hypothetical protein
MHEPFVTAVGALAVYARAHRLQPREVLVAVDALLGAEGEGGGLDAAHVRKLARRVVEANYARDD